MIKSIKSSEILEIIETPELHPWEFITVHHTVHDVTNIDKHWGEEIDEDHRSGLRKGYPKFRNGLGYHFLINPDGVIEVGDRWIQQIHGAHNLGWNKRSIGIGFVGNFSKFGNRPIPKQVESFSGIRKNLSELNLRIYPHCVFRATECPGKNIDLRNWFRIFEGEIFL